MTPPASSRFAHRLNLFDALMIVIGGIVGSGIFILPSSVARTVQTPFLIFAVWAVGGLVALAGAFIFAELSTVIPRAGGEYAFLHDGLHPLAGFLHGWSSLFIIRSGVTAVMAVTCGQYLARVLQLSPDWGPGLAVGVLLVLVGFHGLGIQPAAVLIDVITAGKVLAIGAVVLGALLLVRHADIAWEPRGPSGGAALPATLLSGLVPVMFAYSGWQNLSPLAEEVKQPLRNLPRAILAGVGCVIAIYLSMNAAYVTVLTPAGLAATKTPAADVAARLLGEWGGSAVSLLIVASTFGSLNLGLLCAPRVYYAMASDGLFFRFAAHLDPRSRVPTRAIALQGALAAALVLSSSYEKLLGYVVFAEWLFFALCGAALIVLRRRRPDAARPFPAPLYPGMPIAFSLFAAGLVVNTFLTNTQNALIGVGIMGLGAGVFWAVRSRAGAPKAQLSGE